MNDIQSLYQQVILDHNKNPRNFGPLLSANHSADGLNPLCGDDITVHLLIENDIIKEISFEGSGCAIAKSSARRNGFHCGTTLNICPKRKFLV